MTSTPLVAELFSKDAEQLAARRYYDAGREANLAVPCTAELCSDFEQRICQYELLLDHQADHGLPQGCSKRQGQLPPHDYGFIPMRRSDVGTVGRLYNPNPLLFCWQC